MHLRCDAYHVTTQGKLSGQAVAGRYGKGFPSDLVKRTKAILSALQAAAVLDDQRVDVTDIRPMKVA